MCFLKWIASDLHVQWILLCQFWNNNGFPPKSVTECETDDISVGVVLFPTLCSNSNKCQSANQGILKKAQYFSFIPLLLEFRLQFSSWSMYCIIGMDPGLVLNVRVAGHSQEPPRPAPPLQHCNLFAHLPLTVAQTTVEQMPLPAYSSVLCLVSEQVAMRKRKTFNSWW